ncbi:hypothetical protein [Streptomyces sp. NPDC055692]|uniref:hypothetical protein n=1 Tax=Streptomyces sp. NPDC055692 TaxID=3155683 RepID=UPI00343B1D21
MEAVRVRLGEKQLNWYGIHYSTLLGKTYAQLYRGFTLDRGHRLLCGGGQRS